MDFRNEIAAGKASCQERTLVFCTAYSDGAEGGIYTWQRYRLWIEAIKQSKLRYDQVLLVDDGSTALPNWPDTDIVHEHNGLISTANIVLYHFQERLGRRSVTDFPGWVRSFFLPAAWAAANGFSRVIHVESDAFLISERMQTYCNDIAEGWIAPWCQRYQWAESAIQIIAGNALRSYSELAGRSIDDWSTLCVERALPFTHVETGFIGDRFGDYSDFVPRDADWASQANCQASQQPEHFYWWLSGATSGLSRHVKVDRVELGSTFHDNVRSDRSFHCSGAIRMNSFDVFDTLIARRYLTSQPIFEQISREFKINNFVEARIKADTGTLGLDGIYLSMGLGAEIMAREVELEHEHAFPIKGNLDRVCHGDMLISDMYMPACDILSILRSVGLNKQVTVYQSNGDKRTGDVWRHFGEKKPELHVGDNVVSDFEVPRQYGINCELYENSALTEFELYMLNSGLPSVGFLMREVRLRAHPKIHSIFSEISGQLNLPWLFIAAELLRRRNIGPLVFLGRDSQLLYLIYRNYFAYSYYLPFSRKVAYYQPHESVRYLLAHAPKNAHFVDVGSTGATWEKLRAPFDFTALLYIDDFHYTRHKPELPQRFSYIMKRSECRGSITHEMFNCGDHGYIAKLFDYDYKDLFRAAFSEEREIDAEIVDAIHVPVKMSLELSKFYRAGIRAELMALDDLKLLELFRILIINVCRQNFVEQLVINRPRLEQAYLAEMIGASA